MRRGGGHLYLLSVIRHPQNWLKPSELDAQEGPFTGYLTGPLLGPSPSPKLTPFLSHNCPLLSLAGMLHSPPFSVTSRGSLEIQESIWPGWFPKATRQEHRVSQSGAVTQ